MGAPTLTSNLIEDGAFCARKIVTAAFTDTQETTVTKLDISTLAGAAGSEKVAIECIRWNINDADAVITVLLGSTVVLSLSGMGEMEGEGGLLTVEGDDVKFTTANFSSGSTYQVEFSVRKCSGFSQVPVLSSIEIPAGDYETGSEIPATATFGAAVTGTVATLDLSVNGTTKVMTMLPGPTAVTQEFRYLVRAEDHAELTQVTLGTMNKGAGALSLYGGSPITGANIASYTSDVTDVTVNAAATVTGIAFTDGQSGAYVTAETIEITLTFSKNVVVTGTPRIQLLITSGNKYATYKEYGTAHNKLIFRYPVVAGDVALATGFDVATNALGLNSGTIQNEKAPAVSATLTLPASDTAAFTIN